MKSPERYRSFHGNIKEFLKTTIHADFLHEIDLRIKPMNDILDDPELVYNGRTYDLARGGKRTLVEAKTIFEDILENILEPLEGDENDS